MTSKKKKASGERSRSATASIRGYLYQTVLAAQAWVSLQPGEELVVEGDEDFDRILQGRNKEDPSQESVQIKARERRIGLKSAAPSLKAFAEAYARSLGEPGGKKLTFLYLSTETLRPPKTTFDPLRAWVEGQDLDKVAQALAALALEKKWRIPWPGKTKTADWDGFVRAVRFEVEQPRLEEQRAELARLLSLDGRAQGMAHVGALPQRLVDHLLTSSSQEDPRLRRWTRQDLDTLLAEVRGKLGEWARGDRAKRLVGWMDATERLSRILWDGTRELEHPERPSQLLDPSYEVIPFLEEPRTKELASFQTWCAGVDRFSVRVVVGAGGTGKTRLFVELCKRLRGDGWHAGFLQGDASAEGARIIAAGLGPRCVVIDYAETRPEVTASVLRAGKASTDRCRIVLLARESGPWLSALARQGHDEGEALAASSSGEPRETDAPQIETLELENLTEKGSRPQIFQRMVRAFAEAREEPFPEPVPRIDLSDSSLDLALLLAMAALEASDGRAVVGTHALLDATLDHEGRFWIRWLAGRGIQDADGEAFWATAEAVAALTLRGRFKSKAEAGAVLLTLGKLDPLDPAMPPKTLRTLLGSYYPHGEGYAAGLQPDVLGEHAVMRALEHREGEGRALLLAALEGADAEAVENACVVLGRLGARLDQPSPQGTGRAQVNAWIESLLSADLPTRSLPAFTAAKSLGTHTAFGSVADTLACLLRDAEPEGVLPIAREILNELDNQNPTPVSLRRLGVVCGQTAAAALQADPKADEEELARVLNNLSVRLSALGRREEALAATQEAVEIRRQLAASRPDAFLPDLATSLNNLGAMLSNLGRREEALKATQEAVKIRRQLAASRPDAFLPDLATSLNNLGAMLSNLGRREKALEATQEAVKIRRQLAASRPDAFLPNLATSLNNLGKMLSDLGRREKALEATQEAVEVYRQLAASRPDAFLPDLAGSLNNLGIRLSALGRREEALEATQEAVAIRRQLAETRPDAFLPDLATSLNNLGSDLSDLGRREEALEATQEAVEAYRQLAGTRPDAFLPDVAMSLNNLGNRLSDLGRREEALEATEEAVEIQRHLAASRPDAFLPDLATSLNNLGAMLSNLGRREKALEATQEAVKIRRQLAASRPDAFLPNLATSLNNLGKMLSDLGRREKALEATQEAVEIQRHLAESRPDAFLPDLATSLNNLGSDLSDLGRREEALAATQEAVKVYRQLAASRPDAFLPDVAMSLNNLGIRLSALGRREEALEATQEAVEIQRHLAESRPDAFLPDLALYLGAHGAALLAGEQPKEALASFQEGLRLLLPLARRLPAAHRSLTLWLRGKVQRSAEAAGVEADADLLAEVAEIYGDDANDIHGT